jgi:hypothetical protein
VQGQNIFLALRQYLKLSVEVDRSAIIANEMASELLKAVEQSRHG